MSDQRLVGVDRDGGGAAGLVGHEQHGALRVPESARARR
jgi:hypothetical protein